MRKAKLPHWAHAWTLPKRFKVAKGGRGGAKSHTIAALLLIMGAAKPLRILCTREIQKSIKDSVHRLLSDKIASLGLEGFYESLESEIRGKNGTLFIFSGLRSEVMAGLKSTEGVDICWVEEAHSVSQHSMDILIPTIRKPGSEIWWSFNPELETDPVYIRFCGDPEENVLLTTVGIEDNPWAPTELLEEMRRSYERDPARAAWIWGGACRPTAEGAIYEREMQDLTISGRITSIPYEAAQDTIVALDLGIGDHTSLVVGQWIGHERRVLHTYESFGVPLSHYIDHLKLLPYRIDQIILPHDAHSKSLQTGKTPAEMIEQAFPETAVTVLPRTQSIEHDINHVREHFAAVWIDRKAETLLEALKKYRRRFNDRTGMFAEPLHDTYSDMADAFRYWMQAVRKTARHVAAAPTFHSEWG